MHDKLIKHNIYIYFYLNQGNLSKYNIKIFIASYYYSLKKLRNV